MDEKYTFTTEEERRKIKKLGDMGVCNAEIARITGRSYTVIESIIDGSYEAKKEADRKRQAMKRLREEAEKAGAGKYVPIEEPAASPFENENLALRIADSNDYTNALLNGALNKLEMLCKALGVGA